MPLNLSDLIAAVATASGDRTALVYGDIRRSWRETSARINRLTNVLLDHGVGGAIAPPTAPWLSTHDHLALLMENCPEYLEGVVAAHRARVAPLNVNYRYTAAEIAYLFGDAQPAAVLFQSRFAAQVAEAVASLERRPLLIQVADRSGHRLIPGAIAYESAIASASPVAPGSVTPSPEDLHILYTGGTTGLPKGVLWRVGDLLAGPLGVRSATGTPCTTYAEALDRLTTKRQRVLLCPPLMHGAGLWFALGAWCAGGTVVIQPPGDSLDAEAIIETCARESIEAMLIVGDAFARPLVAALRRSGADLPRLRAIVNAAAALGDSLKAELCDLLPGVRVVDRLGASETGPLASRVAGAGFRPGSNLAVVAEDYSRLLQPGDPELGWLAQRGGIPQGYLGDRAKTQQTFREVDGLMYAIPGDRARFNSDGTFTLLGRDSMTINTGGEKVFAEEVEDALRRVPGVADALVVGQPSARWGEQVVAVVELIPGSQPTDGEVLNHASQRLARYKLPKRLMRVSQIQRHANGKADYTWARRVLAAEEASTDAAASPTNAVQ